MISREFEETSIYLNGKADLKSKSGLILFSSLLKIDVGGWTSSSPHPRSLSQEEITRLEAPIN